MKDNMLNKKSKANLRIAKLCLNMKNDVFHSIGVSRAYYAIFQATKYLLVKNCFDYKKFKLDNPGARKQRDYAHGNIREALESFLLNKRFNKQEDLIFIKEMYATFAKLYNLRILADYEIDIINKKDLEKAIKRAEMFINKLKKYNY